MAIGLAGAAALGGLSIVGDLMGQRNSYNSARKLRKTAYQDTMADMKLAGLNPILAYQKGASPATAVPMSNLGGNAVNAGVNASDKSSAKALRHEQTVNLAANTNNTNQQAATETLKTEGQRIANSSAKLNNSILAAEKLVKVWQSQNLSSNEMIMEINNYSRMLGIDGADLIQLFPKLLKPKKGLQFKGIKK